MQFAKDANYGIILTGSIAKGIIIKTVKILLALGLALLLAASALAQKPSNIIRAQLGTVGSQVSVTLQKNSIYIIDPWSGDGADADADVYVENGKGCITPLWGSRRFLGFFSTIRTKRFRNCDLTLNVNVKENTEAMTFIRALEVIPITLTNSWQELRLKEGSYAVLGDDKAIALEIDVGRAWGGCHAAHDHPTYGIWDDINRNHDTSSAAEFKPGIANFNNWFRNLHMFCRMEVRLLVGSPGDTLKLLKLSNQEIHPPS